MREITDDGELTGLADELRWTGSLARERTEDKRENRVMRRWYLVSALVPSDAARALRIADDALAIAGDDDGVAELTALLGARGERLLRDSGARRDLE